MNRLSCTLIAICLGTASAASAQTFPTADPVIKHIYAIGIDSSRLEKEAHVLFDSLGPRLMGTPNIKRAQDWLVSTYKSWGVDAKEEQYGTWRGWERGHSHIDLVSPRKRTLQGQMVGYSPGTGGRDVTLEAIVLPRFADSTAFVKWLPQAKGKLVMISAPLATCRPQDDWAANATAESKARMDSIMVGTQREWASVRVNPNNPGVNGASAGVRGTGYSSALGGGELGVRLEQGGAAGIITSRPKLQWTMGGGRTPQQVVEAMQNPNAGRGGFGFGGGALNTGWGAMEVFETYNVTTPAIALDCEDYGLVARLAENGDRPKLALNLDGKLLGEQPVFNVVAQIKGTEHPDEYVMLSAHFDSWDGSSGATDNGTGTLTMLEAMRILKDAYPKPKRTILVGHWSGEEEGEVGSKAFSEDHPEVTKGLQALFNQDNGTGRIRSIGGGGLVHSPEHLNDWLGKIPKEFSAQINGGNPIVSGRPAGGGSDDFSFGCAGLPAFGLGATPWDYNTVTWHTERDTYDKVVFDDLKYNATLTAMLAYLASEDPTRIPLDRVDLAAQATTAGRPGGGRGGFGTTWPQCEKAPRKTNPRLK
jgi:hypothetical protein